MRLPAKHRFSSLPSFSHDLGAAMPRRLPPLNALKAFEAAARHESFTRAAEELCVTQGAVSHQVKALEAELGLKLFNRERQRLVITEAGPRLSRRGARRLRPHRGRAPSGCCSGRAPASSPSARRPTSPPSGWCTGSAALPRRIPTSISGFRRTLHHVDFAREDVDLAVRHGDGDWPGLARDAAVRGAAVPGLQPEAADRSRRPAHAGRPCSSFTLLHLDDRKRLVALAGGRRRRRRRTLARAGPQPRQHGDRCRRRRPGRRARPHHARRLGPDQRPPRAAVRSGLRAAQVLLDRLPQGDRALPKIATFRDWLLAEAADDARRASRRPTLEATGSSAASRLLIRSCRARVRCWKLAGLGLRHAARSPTRRLLTVFPRLQYRDLAGARVAYLLGGDDPPSAAALDAPGRQSHCRHPRADVALRRALPITPSTSARSTGRPTASLRSLLSRA